VLPFVSPVTTIGEDAPVFVKTAPLDESFTTTMYEVIAPPPTLAGAVKVTDTCAFPAVAVPIVGASGVCSGKYEAVRIAA
jgi:nitrate reductase NapE component